RQLFAPTVWQEMLIVQEILGQDPQPAKDRAEQLPARFRFALLKAGRDYTVSRGQQQRLAIWTMLMGGAGFCLLDAPTAGLDRAHRTELYKLMDELLLEGKGLAVISHSRELASRWKCRQVRLREGQVLA